MFKSGMEPDEALNKDKKWGVISFLIGIFLLAGFSLALSANIQYGEYNMLNVSVIIFFQV
jgi:hypothetical protein